MRVIELERDGDVFVLRMDDGENRFSPGMLEALEGALDTVAEHDGPTALVTTGTGKFFSNGLDLDWLSANGDQAAAYLARVQGIFVRLLRLPCVTVAAANGHTYAGGAMLALSHDHRVMRTDRGYWCLPEVNLGMPFTVGMNALIPAMLPTRTAHEAMVTGRRYTAAEALAAGIIDRAVPEADVVPVAVAYARELAPKAGRALAGIRTHLHAPVIDALLAG